ncbi:MAG: dienelactone hydrolase family protein [Bdellovibrionota bacterium]
MSPKIRKAESDIVITGDHVFLEGKLVIPEGANSIVMFAHGSGSGRFSPRNNYVAGVLQDAGIGTLLLDLLSEGEENNRQKVFDIELLAERLIRAKNWLSGQPETLSLKLGYFGASTGAGAALVAAAREPDNVFAVVSRGGRPDLATYDLRSVTAPTLLIVGGEDYGVIELNQEALDALTCTKRLEIVPGATHLFEEPGTLERVAELATGWFTKFAKKRESKVA